MELLRFRHINLISYGWVQTGTSNFFENLYKTFCCAPFNKILCSKKEFSHEKTIILSLNPNSWIQKISLVWHICFPENSRWSNSQKKLSWFATSTIYYIAITFHQELVFRVTPRELILLANWWNIQIKTC